MLPTDMALIEDKEFLPYVKKCELAFCCRPAAVPTLSGASYALGGPSKDAQRADDLLAQTPRTARRSTTTLQRCLRS